jgi:hypothetical protein
MTDLHRFTQPTMYRSAKGHQVKATGPRPARRQR